jgi:acetylornithine deacetylase/succinyl-diaminopimelate desuccinylase-like protein
MFACLLPGYNPADLVADLRRMAGDEVEFEVTEPGDAIPDQPDMGLFNTLAAILRECDPQGVPVPLLLTTPTDARLFDRLGIQTYGFQPMKLPPEVEMAKLAHAPDERIPVTAVEFGAEAIYQALHRFGEK